MPPCAYPVLLSVEVGLGENEDAAGRRERDRGAQAGDPAANDDEVDLVLHEVQSAIGSALSSAFAGSRQLTVDSQQFRLQPSIVTQPAVNLLSPVNQARTADSRQLK